MKRLLRYLTGPRPYHRRNWRRLWRYCRCGWRWRCPDSIDLVLAPYQPPPPVQSTEAERAERGAPPAASPEASPATVDATPPPAARSRSVNRRPGWETPARAHRANDRAAGLTPASEYHARRGARV